MREETVSRERMIWNGEEFDNPRDRDRQELADLTVDERIALEMDRQRRIFRPGADEARIMRAAINALIERGEYA